MSKPNKIEINGQECSIIVVNDRPYYFTKVRDDLIHFNYHTDSWDKLPNHICQEIDRRKSLLSQDVSS